MMFKSMAGAATVLMLVAAALLGPGAAVARKSDVYDHFKRCPTGAPEMNDPAKRGVVCVSNTVREGSFKVGNLQAAIDSPTNIQFAFTVTEGAEEGDPQTIALVPGSTSLEGAPIVLPNPFYTPPAAPGAAAAPPAAAKKKAKKKHRKKCKKHQRKCKRAKHKKHKKKPKKPAVPAPVPTVPPVATDPFIKIAVQTAGDIRNFDIQSIFGESGSLYEMPVKLQVTGEGLGPNCFIGSDAKPILLGPVPISPFSSFQIGSDPNGLNVELLSLGGADTEDATFTAPGAHGCGTVVDPAAGTGSLDTPINSLIGLPATAGASKVVFGNLLIEMAAAIIDGTPPDGGAALKEAFEAATH
ncbi:MAG TPA: hypothetical protein VMS60_00025 [Solirubrobacterales bacterium]|nr:hypothetical protein [Solirubrobacterales bacterium]